MQIIETSLPGVKIIEPDVFGDRRGFFLESYHRKRYREGGVSSDFVQDNLSFSRRGTLRGLHYQLPHEQAKLVQVLQGEVFDVAVDIRRGSPTFGQWTGARLSAENKRQLFIPEGFAHGFCVLSETALFLYKCSDFYHPECEGGVLWCDPHLGIDWPIEDPVLSEKDRGYLTLGSISADRLPACRA
jgi:dTDP-4-dehydrorhamnose 3,5-epimerase